MEETDMAQAKYAKDGYIKNMELLAYTNLDEKDGGQMGYPEVGNRWYLYMSSRVPGWHVIEITDPQNPGLYNSSRRLPTRQLQN